MMNDDNSHNESIDAFGHSILQQSINEVEPAVEQKLASARAAAVTEAANRKNPLAVHWGWGGAIAACMVIAVFLTYDRQVPVESSPVVATNLETDLLLLSEINDEDMAIIEELEFAYWLSQNEELHDDQDIITRG